MNAIARFMQRHVWCRFGRHPMTTRNPGAGWICPACGHVTAPITWPPEIYQKPTPPTSDDPFKPNSPAGIYYVTCVDRAGGRHMLFAYFNPRTQHWSRAGEQIGFADSINPPGQEREMRIVSMVNRHLQWYPATANE